MKRISVTHVTDTLETGGTERVAVNLSNLLAENQFDACLCSTRRDGPLASLVGPDVRRLRLQRSHAADLPALRRLVAHNQAQRVDILHAHSTSVFVAVAAAAFAPHPAVIWHDHFGSSDVRERPSWIYRTMARRVAGVVSVNQTLRRWAVDRLRVPEARAWYLPNFVCVDAGASPIDLPGVAGYRIVSVANLRPQKDHLTLVEALAAIVRVEPRAHLLMVGACPDAGYRDRIAGEIRARGLDRHATILGERSDVPRILRACDVGVLSSRSEGLPLAVLEYGAAGLPAVATRVGQLAEVLDDGHAGILVPSGSVCDLAAGVISLLASPSLRAKLGRRLRDRVDNAYSAASALRQLSTIYDTVLTRRAHAA